MLHENIDKTVTNESAQGPEPQCKPGCSHCCNLRVEASDPEALNIAQHLQTLPPQDLEPLKQRLQAKAQYHQQGLAPPSGRMACAFLQDQHCTIYAVRPATCRKCHSLSVAACESGAEVIPQNLPLLVQCEVLVAGANAAFQNFNLPASPMELSAAVLAALANPLAAEAWYQGSALLSTPPQPCVSVSAVQSGHGLPP